MSKMKILVADDEEGIRDLIYEALSQLGHEVRCAVNGMEAISLIASEPADILFLDIRMPNGDGLTALREIHRMRPSMPVVMITGCGEHELIDQSLEMGSMLCLMKPFGIRDLIAALDMAQIMRPAA